MEVDPALQPPGALSAGQRVLKTSINDSDYYDASWKNEFEKGDFLNMIKAEKLDGLKKLLGHSKWNSKSANLCNTTEELQKFQLSRLCIWFAQLNRLFISMLWKACKESKVKSKDIDILISL
eukprot:865862-Rhodomonas_salina.1